MMDINIFLLLTLSVIVYSNDESEEPVLYYYGLEESERSLPWCRPRQACSALMKRYWRAPALVRLCRCSRRQRCDTLAKSDYLIELNNRAHLQFCHPVTDWPECTAYQRPLIVISTNDRMNPDEIEELHHRNIQLTPPKIMFTCRCRNPNYWRLNSTTENIKEYQCASPPFCRTDEFCGNVDYDLNTLYQSCLCQNQHICVHNGGITHLEINELLYYGRGWKAYCRRIGNDYSYEDY